jgi:isopenicillin-N N-acyltransferase like protein
MNSHTSREQGRRLPPSACSLWILRFALAATLLAAPVFARADEPSQPGDGRVFVEKTHGAGSLRYVEDIPVLSLSGSPEQIAEQHAMLCKDALGPLLETPKKVLEDFGVNYNLVLPVATVAAKGMAANAPERYRTEMDGIAKAAGIDPSLLYIGNSLVELRRMGGCAAFIVEPQQSATGGMLFGRNFDFPTFDVLDKYSCVMIVRPNGLHAFASVAVPGVVGVLSGINDQGLSIATLDVYSSSDGSPKFDLRGVPLALTYRRILEECATVDEARKLLEETPRTTYMNLAACDRGSAVIFELTPKSVGVRRPEGQVLRCTNHFELPELSTHVHCLRFFTLGKLAEFKGDAKYSVDEVQKMMHSVNQGSMTFQTMIFEPSSLRLRVVFGPGPVSDKPLHLLELKDLFAQGPKP